MARTTASLPLLAILFCISAGAIAAARSVSISPVDFIKSSCRSTRYPALCFQCLSAYAPSVRNSPRQLAVAGLSVSVNRAQSASAFVTQLSSSSKSIKYREAGAVRDCIETMADSVDRLRRSVKEMGNMGRVGTPNFQWHYSNVQTWVSAALTDENTCLDSFAGSNMDGNIKVAIRGKVVSVAQVTSNALALVNQIGSKH